MPVTAMEARLAALHALAEAVLPIPVQRNRATPAEVPPQGYAVLWDGEPGEPQHTFPLRYHYDHVAELHLYAQAADGATPSRAAILDPLRQAFGAAVAANRTLGGLCDWVEAELAETDAQPIDGAAPIRFDILRVTLSYATDNPLT